MLWNLTMIRRERQCSLTDLALSIGHVYAVYNKTLFASMDESTFRDIQWMVLQGKYAFSPLILEIRLGEYSQDHGIPDF